MSDTPAPEETVVRNEDRDGEVAEGLIAFDVTEPFDPVELSITLGVAVGEDRVPVTAEGDPATASPEEPVTIWVANENIDAGVVTTALATEVPPVAPVVPPAEAAPEVPPSENVEDMDFLRTVALKPENQKFTPDEIEGILRIFLAPYKKTLSEEPTP